MLNGSRGSKGTGTDFRTMMKAIVERYYGKSNVVVDGKFLLIYTRGRRIEVLVADTYAVVYGFLTDEHGRRFRMSSDDPDSLLYLSCIPGLRPGVQRTPDGYYAPCYSFLIYDTDLKDPEFPIRTIDNMWSMTGFSSNIWERPMTLDVVDDNSSDQKR